MATKAQKAKAQQQRDRDQSQSKEQEEHKDPAAVPTEEQLAKQAKDNFEANVEEAMADPTAALQVMMDKHTVAVTARATHDAAKSSFDTRNSKSLESIKGSQVRLAVARTDLLNQWNSSVESNNEEVEVGEGDEARTYIAGLNFGFDDGQDDGPEKESEKEYWLAAQSYNRIASSIAKEPAELSDLRGASDTAQGEYDAAHAIYAEAIKRQVG